MTCVTAILKRKHLQCVSFYLLYYLSFTFFSSSWCCSLFKHILANTHSTVSVYLNLYPILDRYLLPLRTFFFLKKTPSFTAQNFFFSLIQRKRDTHLVQKVWGWILYYWELWNRAETVLHMCLNISIQYLVYTLWILQPCIVHLFHIVGAGAVKKGLSSDRCVQVPHRLKRP